MYVQLVLLTIQLAMRLLHYSSRCEYYTLKLRSAGGATIYSKTRRQVGGSRRAAHPGIRAVMFPPCCCAALNRMLPRGIQDQYVPKPVIAR
jgi:hypothetical protein